MITFIAKEPAANDQAEALVYYPAALACAKMLTERHATNTCPDHPEADQVFTVIMNAEEMRLEPTSVCCEKFGNMIQISRKP